MAGDWIKVEKGGGQKPETLKMARMLGIPRRECYGLLVEFWEWLDTNCVDGVVDGVVDADVDALMSCPGLSALLKLVGWVRFEDEPPRLIVANFERHNGETSKNRALRNARQAKWRANVDAPVDAQPSTKASTREEKRREEKNKPTTKAAIAAGGFDAFWFAYPKKKSKGDAEKAWLKLKPDAELQARILSAIQAAKSSRDWQKDGGQFILHPATWLNAKGWEDELGPARSSMDVGQVV